MSIFGPNGTKIPSSYKLGGESLDAHKSPAELKMSFYQEPVQCRKCGVKGTIPARQSALQPLQLPPECPQCGVKGGLALVDPTGKTRIPNPMAVASFTWICASEEASQLREKIDYLTRRLDAIEGRMSDLGDDIKRVAEALEPE